MVITRKIELRIDESDKDLRNAYYKKLRDHRNIAVKVANMTASHLFALDNTMPYLSEEDREHVTFLGVKGDAATRQNAPYVAASEAFKGQADMSMVTCVIQNVRKMYQSDCEGGGMWQRSLRSYKADLPVPFKKGQFLRLRFEQRINGEGKPFECCCFTLIGIPFAMRFGRDRSNNRVIVQRIVNGEYKMCTSSIQEKNNKWFLLLCVDIPDEKQKLIKGKKLYAYLGIDIPIVCATEISANREYDSGIRFFQIGSKEEFLHRRIQIQEARRRCQIANRYTVGGHGRRHKTQALDRFSEREANYVTTKQHTYSRLLVNEAVRHNCDTIVLMQQQQREDIAREGHNKVETAQDAENRFLLVNWSYYGLKDKISYKAKRYGIAITEEA